MVFGNGIVVLVGDFCLARALETVALTGSLPVVQSLAATVTEMAEGEVAQLERAGNPDATIDDYFRVIDRKTASLIAWCTRVGGAVGPAYDGPLDRYGRALGRAFQIADDVLDSDVDEATAGKSVGHDLTEGKLTLPVLLACEADPALGKYVRSQLGERGVPAEVAAEILQRCREAGGVERARQKARELAATAADSLAALPESPHRDGAARPGAVRRRPEVLVARRTRRQRRRRRLGDGGAHRPHSPRQPARLRAPARGARRAAADRARGRPRSSR